MYMTGKQHHLLPFRHDTLISDDKGLPRDSTVYYFPIETFYDSIHSVWYTDPKTKLWVSESVDGGCSSREELSKQLNVPVNLFVDSFEKRVNTFEMKWFSFYLYKMQEPVLYNYFLEKDVYRFTWLRSFNIPVTITIEKEQNAVTITTKALKKNIDLPSNATYENVNGKEVKMPLDLNAAFVINKKKTLSEKDFLEFKKLIDSLNLYSYPSFPYSPCLVGTDGAEWIFEAQNKEGYFYMVRWSPEKETALRKVGEFLIKLSDAKDEKIY